MKLRYKIQLLTGEVIEREENFESKDALYSSIRGQSAQLISVEEVTEKGLSSFLKRASSGGKIKEEHKITFARNLSSMLEAGLPLARALSVIERQTKSKKMKQLVTQIINGINTGKPLSDLLEAHPTVFSSLFVSMVRAGEESGNLVNAFRVVADQLERSYKLKKKVKGAMMYPAIIFSAMIIIGVLMMIYVVPTLTATFKELNVELPLSTQMIILVSDTMKAHAFLVFLGLGAMIAGLVMFARSKKGKRIIGITSLRIPVIGNLVREVNAARTATTLSSLLTAGVEFVRSIEITEEVVQNPKFKAVLAEVRESIKKGGVMSETLKKYEKLYPPLVGEMAAVGEETGKIAELLGKVGEFYEEDVEEQTKNMSTIIEPFLMVFIGLAVGFFAISMVGPMYSLSSSI